MPILQTPRFKLTFVLALFTVAYCWVAFLPVDYGHYEFVVNVPVKDAYQVPHDTAIALNDYLVSSRCVPHADDTCVFQVESHTTHQQFMSRIDLVLRTRHVIASMTTVVNPMTNIAIPLVIIVVLANTVMAWRLRKTYACPAAFYVWLSSMSCAALMTGACAGFYGMVSKDATFWEHHYNLTDTDTFMTSITPPNLICVDRADGTCELTFFTTQFNTLVQLVTALHYEGDMLRGTNWSLSLGIAIVSTLYLVFYLMCSMVCTAVLHRAALKAQCVGSSEGDLPEPQTVPAAFPLHDRYAASAPSQEDFVPSRYIAVGDHDDVRA